MTNLGLKLWNINTQDYLPLVEELYEKKLFDYVELYILPGNLDKLEDWKKLNTPFGIHAPHFQHGMNLSKAENFENNLKLYEEVKKYADELKANYIVFHSGTDGDYKETAKQLLHINDPRTVIENKPYKTLPFIDGDYYVGGKVEEIKYIINTVKCKFCLDIGHAVSAANALNVEPYGYIEEFMKLKPSMFHLSDINILSDMDQHLNYGQGTLDFERLVKILPANPTITIETNKKSKENLDDFVCDAKFLRSKLNKKLPISATICTYNEEKRIESCIESVLRNNVEEVIVVDGNSTDKTVELVEKYKEVKLIKAQKGLATQRQIGIENAKCPYVAIIDADDKLEDNCLEILLKEMQEYNFDAIQGRHLSREAATYWEKAMDSAVSQITHVDEPEECNMVGRPVIHTAESLKACGGFDPLFNGGGNDDTDLAIRLKMKGYRLAHGTGETRRSHADTFSKFFKKLCKYGRDDARLLYKYPKRRVDLCYHLLIRYPIIYSFNVIKKGKIQYVPFYVIFGLVRFFTMAKEYIKLLVTKPEFMPY